MKKMLNIIPLRASNEAALSEHLIPIKKQFIDIGPPENKHEPSAQSRCELKIISRRLKKVAANYYYAFNLMFNWPFYLSNAIKTC